jgi:LuxR family transcriptional regulator, maltose regulon positive regulatory protein
MPNLALAKLTRPRLYGIVSRARLFQRLDAGRHHPLLWVSGPPGAGKTSLVASYVAERKMAGLWYQVDAEDGDPATFFYYLGKSLEKVSKGRPGMPVLAPEHLPDPGRFARRFFREMFDRLDEGSIVVFDNCQEAAHEAMWARLIEIAAEEMPDGINLICVSRTAPPPALARLESTGRLTTLGWSDLRLNLEETRQIALAKQGISESALALVCAQSDGWAAGLTLMLERLSRTGEIPESIAAETQEAVFDYFAGSLFDRVSIENRHVLLCTSLLPTITAALAEKLTGNPGAGKLLEDLHRRQLFTHRRLLARGGGKGRSESVEPTYEYHALFRAFLRSKAKEDYTPAALRRQAAAAAKLLDEAGQPEAAVALYREAEDWVAQRDLVLRQAPVLLRQGRGQTLREWTGAMPPDVLQDNPWLLYWLGVSLIPTDQREASNRLEWVFEQLVKAKDGNGQALVAARIIEAEHRAYTSLMRLDRWIDVLSQLIQGGFALPEPEVELRVYSSLLMALFLRDPRHPLLQSSVERLCELVSRSTDPDQILAAGEVLLRYFDHGGHVDRADGVISLVHAVIDDEAVAPLSQLYWWGRVADFYGRQARHDEGAIALAKADQLAIDFEGHPSAAVIRNFHVFSCLLRGDVKQASALDARADRSAYAVVGVGRAMRSLIRSLVAAFNAQPKEALELNAVALAGYREAGMVFPAINTQIARAALLAHGGSSVEFNTQMVAVRQEMQGTFMQHHEAQLLLIDAFVAIRGHRPQQAAELIRRALASRPASDLFMLRMVPEVLPCTLAFALSEGLGEAQIKQWISRFRVSGGPDAPQAWPWPIKIQTLGAFGLVREERPVVFKGKMPRKPLDLLQLLVCAGAAGLTATAIADKFWPELEGDAALNNVDTNLHRLRKLLGFDAAIKSTEGRLAINASICWVDAWAVERLVATQNTANAQTDCNRSDRALDLYRGHFLHEQSDRPWVVTYRERLRAQVIALVQESGTLLLHSGQAHAAKTLFERALAVDDLAEPLYRGLMRCLGTQGEPAQALKVYRRCKDMLSIGLGVQPSPETQALATSMVDLGRN